MAVPMQAKEVVSIKNTESTPATAAFPRASEPEGWLESMAEATRQLTYRGHFVYQQGSSLETLSVLHAQQSGNEKELIRYLDGLPREVLRHGREITFASADRPPVRFEHESLMPMVGRFTGNNLGKYYQLRPAALDRVAGREALQLLVVPTDRFRYGYQIWLDRQSSLMLKSVMVDSEGRIIERMQFTNLEFPERLSEQEQKLLNRTSKGQPDETTVTMSSPDKEPHENWGWEAGWIPDGFEVRNRARRQSPVSDRMVDTVIYSDGIASFSVFVEPDETRVLSQTSEQIGSMAAVSKVFRNNETYFHVTVVGEVPLGTAERVAVSVRPASEKQADKR
ncbi:hypothetical protein GZ77_01530 [Endozoicomonas montiporae]|uniref:Uncharacterized protein n=2 Tax=Endozoicomonas montiporae TaxID=1027273 RepID=A0A081NA86_9GAMM|nr:MucB/RseB C-terminal domain-containing protein [Endozoicomonas montiporae]KEQ15359.1 hypothetical protein GZ77_01530 [Endozoicomonas montiporae]